MSVIRRWECPKDSELAGWWKGPEGRLALHCDRCDTPMVQVEYVPADQLAGAVKALRQIAAFEVDPDDGWDYSVGVMRAIAADTLDHLGGQSE